jgi:hypothetical protein
MKSKPLLSVAFILGRNAVCYTMLYKSLASFQAVDAS